MPPADALDAPRPRLRVVVGLTGAAAVALSPGLCELLLGRGCEVRVAATRGALRFMPALALAALTREPIVTSLSPGDPASPPPHLELGRWADVMVVYPAGATTLARLAAGSCGSVVTAAALSTRAPVLVVPATREGAYTAPSVRRNLEQLREDGFFVAHPPRPGAAPPVAAVVEMILAVAAQHAARRPPPPSWDAMYRGRRPEELPWFTEALDPDLEAVLDGLDRGAGRLLDLGTGLGAAARAAADRGFSVVATDISARALELARERAGARAIVWMRDDVLDTKVQGSFDVVLDRGLFHVLPRDRQETYVAAVSALVGHGGHLVLKLHAPEEAGDHGTQRLSGDDVRQLFGGAFELVRAEASTLPGPGGRAPRALLCTLRRR